MATFVLVHGAWHGGWCWRKITPLLLESGASVYTPTLSGLGERAHLAEMLEPAQLDLNLHIRDIAQLLEYESLNDVIMVGHAYAGMVITGVAEVCPERLSHLGLCQRSGPRRWRVHGRPARIRARAGVCRLGTGLDRPGRGLPAGAGLSGRDRTPLGYPRPGGPGVDVCQGDATACRSHGRKNTPGESRRPQYSPQLYRRRGGWFSARGGTRSRRWVGHLSPRFGPRPHDQPSPGIGRHSAGDCRFLTGFKPGIAFSSHSERHDSLAGSRRRVALPSPRRVAWTSALGGCPSLRCSVSASGCVRQCRAFPPPARLPGKACRG